MHGDLRGAATTDPSGDDERLARVRQARQVLAGSDVTPPNDSATIGPRYAGANTGELRYFLALAALIVVAALAYVIWGATPASIVLVLLALALLAGWFVL